MMGGDETMDDIAIDDHTMNGHHTNGHTTLHHDEDGHTTNGHTNGNGHVAVPATDSVTSSHEVDTRPRPCQHLACGKWTMRGVERCHRKCNFAYFQLVISGLLFFFTAGGASYSIGYFTDDFIRDLDVSRTALSAAWTAALIGTAVTMPFLGRQVDKRGPRCVLFFCSTAYILGLIMIGVLPTNNIWLVSLSFYLSRSSMSGVQMIGLNVTNQWWVKQKAKAMAVTNATASWSIIFPALLAGLDHRYGWRDAFFVQAALCGTLLFVLAFFTFNRPESYGYWPDASQRWDNQVPAALEAVATEMATIEAAAHAAATAAAAHNTKNNEHGTKYAQLTDSDGDGAIVVVAPSSPPSHTAAPIAASSVVMSPSQTALAAATTTLVDVPINGNGHGNGHDDHDGLSSRLPSSLSILSSDSSDDLNTHLNGGAHSDSSDIGGEAKGPNGGDAHHHIRGAATHGGVTGGTVASRARVLSGAEAEEIHWHWQDALRTPGFWIVALAACALSLLWSGWNFHYGSYLKDHDVDESVGGYIFILVAAGSFVAMFIAGYFFDKIKNKARGMILGTFTNAIVLIQLLVMSAVWQAMIFGFIYGIMDGVLSIGYQAIFAFQFGRAHLATINAIATALTTAMLGLGPLIFGAVHDATGSYTPLLIALLVIGVLSTILLYISPTPKPPRRRVTLTGEIIFVEQ